MEKVVARETGGTQLPPPPNVPRNMKPDRLVELPKRVPVSRTGYGKLGRRVNLITNHFKVHVNVPDSVFFQYSVLIKSADGMEVENKGIGRKIMDKLYQAYSSELAGKPFAYDGEKALYTVGSLPLKKYEFMVVMEETASKRKGNQHYEEDLEDIDNKRVKHSLQSKAFNVEISYAAKIPMRPIALALQGRDVDNTGDALRVLDIILRQQAAKRGCLLVRQSFFHDDSRNLVDVGGGVSACRGFHSSFRTTQSGLTLNTDVSSTIIITPGPVLPFLRKNQNLMDSRQIDWVRAKKVLRNLRVKTTHTNLEFKIIGVSEKPCDQLYFPFKKRHDDGTEETVNITVYDYFVRVRGIKLHESGHMPCLDVGKPKKPNYLPLELCSLVSLQRYTKALSRMQRASLVEKSREKPLDRIRSVTSAIEKYRYDDDPLLKSCGISIEKSLTPVEGRVLNPPTLKVGNGQDCFPRNGRWNFNQKRLQTPTKVTRWVVVNFSSQHNIESLARQLYNCAKSKGIDFDEPKYFQEDPQARRFGPVARVDKMFEQLIATLRAQPYFILCVLPERKNCDIYGPWKRRNLIQEGIITQCIAPLKINDQYLTNVLLKINAKIGGMNSTLAGELTQTLPFLKNTPTMIIGMDVCHGSPGQSDIPSIAAVVGSRCWPSISTYRASVRTQPRTKEMIDALYHPLPNGEDDGIIRELVAEFCESSKHWPEQIILFRDGVGDSQFNQVLNEELEQIIKAIEHFNQRKMPKITVIVAQKNHHTKLFLSNNDPSNVLAGTVVDTGIVHPRNYDFYMCAHNGAIGTSRPAHYHVLHDEIGFSADDLQNLVHSLSYVYQRSTTAVSIVAPICYAHLAAAQMSQCIKSDDLSSDSSSSHGVTTSGEVPVPVLPKLHKNVMNKMFFC
ncbi:Protein argonaute 16 [Ranunculus cassubicifolius]